MDEQEATVYSESRCSQSCGFLKDSQLFMLTDTLMGERSGGSLADLGAAVAEGWGRCTFHMLLFR